jgi:hypothetical protein
LGASQVLDPLVGKTITVTAIVDIMNYIGQCPKDGPLQPHLLPSPQACDHRLVKAF